jgi:hypothetical protein
VINAILPGMSVTLLDPFLPTFTSEIQHSLHHSDSIRAQGNSGEGKNINLLYRPTSMRTIELEKAIVTLRNDNIMHIHIKGGAELHLGDAIQAMEAMGILGEHRKYPVLIDCDEFSSVDKEARIFSASKEANIYTTVDAVAYHSLAHKLFANFYVNHNKPEIPTKIFPSTESAILWLKTFAKAPINNLYS